MKNKEKVRVSHTQTEAGGKRMERIEIYKGDKPEPVHVLDRAFPAGLGSQLDAAIESLAFGDILADKFGARGNAELGSNVEGAVLLRGSKGDLAMTITVYQQVFVDGTRTRAHTTIVGEDGAVIDRRFANYEAFPLAQVAAEHRTAVIKALRRSFGTVAIIYDCNVLGRTSHTKDGVELVSHPRFSGEKTRKVEWAEPAPTEEELDNDDAI